MCRLAPVPERVLPRFPWRERALLQRARPTQQAGVGARELVPAPLAETLVSKPLGPRKPAFFLVLEVPGLAVVAV